MLSQFLQGHTSLRKDVIHISAKNHLPHNVCSAGMTICIQLLLVYLNCCRDWMSWVGKGGNPFQNASAINVIVSVYLEFIRLLICNLIQQTPIPEWGALSNRPTAFQDQLLCKNSFPEIFFSFSCLLI